MVRHIQYEEKKQVHYFMVYQGQAVDRPFTTSPPIRFPAEDYTETIFPGHLSSLHSKNADARKHEREAVTACTPVEDMVLQQMTRIVP